MTNGFLDLTLDQFEKRSMMVSDYVALVVDEQEIESILQEGVNSASYMEVSELLEGLCETDEMNEVYLLRAEPPYDRYTVVMDAVNNQFPKDDYRAYSCGEVVRIPSMI